MSRPATDDRGQSNTAQGDTARDDTGREGQEGNPDEKPDGPSDMKKPSFFFVLRKTMNEFSNDKCTDLAAGLTYYAVLALFPALIALMSIIGLVGEPQETVDTVLGILTDAGAGGAADSIRPAVEGLATSSGALLAFVVSVGLAVWSASAYVMAFGRATNEIYNVAEGRPIWKLRPVMLLITLVLLIIAAAILIGLVVSGPVAESIGSTIGLGSAAITAWSIAKWPVMLLGAALVVAILYYFTPNVKPPKFRWISVGALIAILVWVIASALFGFYVANFSSYNKTYGAFAGVIIFLLWLWITNVALLFGAELDAELERGRELQAGMPAEKDIQLPYRDDKNVKKAEAKEAEDVRRAKALRESRGDTQNK